MSTLPVPPVVEPTAHMSLGSLASTEVSWPVPFGAACVVKLPVVEQGFDDAEVQVSMTLLPTAQTS